MSVKVLSHFSVICSHLQTIMQTFPRWPTCGWSVLFSGLLLFARSLVVIMVVIWPPMSWFLCFSYYSPACLLSVPTQNLCDLHVFSYSHCLEEFKGFFFCSLPEPYSYFLHQQEKVLPKTHLTAHFSLHRDPCLPTNSTFESPTKKDLDWLQLLQDINKPPWLLPNSTSCLAESLALLQ